MARAKKEKAVEEVVPDNKARNEEYLGKIFTMLKKMEGVVLTKARSYFNNSEMRLLGEVILAGYKGKRIISTQLASRLGVTRSAVSQMVNKLEARRHRQARRRRRGQENSLYRAFRYRPHLL